MKKKDLKVGMVVKTREGELYMVMPTCSTDLVLSNGKFWASLNHYKDDITCRGMKDLDIVEVYGFATRPYNATIVSTDGRTLIWEREKKKKLTVAEIEDILGYKIEVVSES